MEPIKELTEKELLTKYLNNLRSRELEIDIHLEHIGNDLKDVQRLIPKGMNPVTDEITENTEVPAEITPHLQRQSALIKNQENFTSELIAVQVKIAMAKDRLSKVELPVVKK